jgi:endonuclease-3
MKRRHIQSVMTILREERRGWPALAVTADKEGLDTPFKVLVSCIISLRTKDQVTAEASARLLARAATPEAMCRLTADTVAGLIYPAGFYRTKAARIVQISHQLAEEYGGVVPDDIDTLLGFNGVGRKTANLVVTRGFGKPGICVDVHVHRICNRWGYVATPTPDRTELVLRKVLPQQYWIEFNDLLVAFGQNHCTPVSPRCSTCRLRMFCRRNGVQRSR